MFFRKLSIALAVISALTLSGCFGEDQAKQVRKLSKQISALELERDTLTQQNSELSKKAKQQGAAQVKYKTEISNLEKKVRDAETAIANQKKLVAAAEQDRASASSKVTDLESKLDVLQKKYDTLKKQMASVKTDGKAPLFHPGEEALVHYWRADGDYDSWGIHIWDTGAAPPTSWEKPKKFIGKDDFGAYAKIKLRSSANLYPVELVAYKGADQDGPHKKFMAIEHPEVWLVESKMDPYFSLEDAKKAKAEAMKNSNAAPAKAPESEPAPAAPATPAAAPEAKTEAAPSKFGDAFGASDAKKTTDAVDTKAPQEKPVEAPVTEAKETSDAKPVNTAEAENKPEVKTEAPPAVDPPAAASKFGDVMEVKAAEAAAPPVAEPPAPSNAPAATEATASKFSDVLTESPPAAAPAQEAAPAAAPAAAEPEAPAKSVFGDVFTAPDASTAGSAPPAP